MTRAALLLTVLLAAGCRSHSPPPMPPGWGRLAFCGPGGGRVDARDQRGLRKELRLARLIERPGQAINALKVLEGKLPDARVSPNFRIQTRRQIEVELDRRLKQPIPLEPVLIELAFAHPTPPGPKPGPGAAQVGWPVMPEDALRNMINKVQLWKPVR